MSDRPRCFQPHPTDKRTCDRDLDHLLNHEAWENPGETRVSWPTGGTVTSRAGTRAEREEWWRLRQGRLYRNITTGEYVEAVRFTRRAGLFAQWVGGTVVNASTVSVPSVGNCASGSWVVLDSAGVRTIVTNAAFTATFTRDARQEPART